MLRTTTPARQANGYRRVFGDTTLQINWQSATLEMTAVAGGATYPLLYPESTGIGIFQLPFEAVLLGIFFSTTWVTAAADEAAGIALSTSSGGPINARGQNSAYFQHEFFNFAAFTAGVPIQRNPGAMWPPPLVKYLSANTSLQIFGSKQGQVNWRTTCIVYFVEVDEYSKLMALEGI